MRFLGAVAICLVVLYGLDEYVFGGMYFSALPGMAIQIGHHF